ncbi:MAG: ECF transporter S component [Eubacteriales bacterium]|nr:ECF transporter S component [Eubacteriales bacterium]
MQTKQAQSIRQLTTAGVLAASIVLLTTLVSIPIPGGVGYINLGDMGVLLAGMLLGGGWGALCAGAASALSDVLLGYTIYAPATFVIKGLVALIAGLLFTKTEKKIRFAALYLAALIVPVGYFLYELLLYGAVSAIPNILFNTLQCLIGAVIATIVGVMLLKTKLFDRQNAVLPICAEILREPKNGPDVVLLSARSETDLIKRAGDMLSVQGIMARIVVIDDKTAYDKLNESQRESYIPKDKPFVRVENAETTPTAVMQAAVNAIGK